MVSIRLGWLTQRVRGTLRQGMIWTPRRIRVAGMAVFIACIQVIATLRGLVDRITFICAKCCLLIIKAVLARHLVACCQACDEAACEHARIPPLAACINDLPSCADYQPHQLDPSACLSPDSAPQHTTEVLMVFHHDRRLWSHPIYMLVRLRCPHLQFQTSHHLVTPHFLSLI